jgi:2-hydroxy-3-keto-5-methylthiopentenyl-1-phosphate phosphatase
VHIFLDFDGTITKQDTIEPLGDYASSVNSRKHLWFSHCKWYQDQSERFDKAHPVDFSPDILEGLGQLGLQHLILAHINDRVDIERQSVELINGYRIFENLPPHVMYKAAQSMLSKDSKHHIEIRDGFGDLLKYLAAKKSEVTVLSVNWSDDWIKGCISPHKLNVISNTIRYGRIQGPGPKLTDDPNGLMLTGGHKLMAMNAARDRLPNLGAGRTYVYIGDSKTDLPCMLECDKAIIMVDEDPAVKSNFVVNALTAMGHQVNHISQVDENFRFAWTQDFTEILKSGNLAPGAPSEVHGLAAAREPSPDSMD